MTMYMHELACNCLRSLMHGDSFIMIILVIMMIIIIIIMNFKNDEVHLSFYIFNFP